MKHCERWVRVCTIQWVLHCDKLNTSYGVLENCKSNSMDSFFIPPKLRFQRAPTVSDPSQVSTSGSPASKAESAISATERNLSLLNRRYSSAFFGTNNLLAHRPTDRKLSLSVIEIRDKIDASADSSDELKDENDLKDWIIFNQESLNSQRSLVNNDLDSYVALDGLTTELTAEIEPNSHPSSAVSEVDGLLKNLDEGSPGEKSLASPPCDEEVSQCQTGCETALGSEVAAGDGPSPETASSSHVEAKAPTLPSTGRSDRQKLSVKLSELPTDADKLCELFSISSPTVFKGGKISVLK